jgi:hypothetical protein
MGPGRGTFGAARTARRQCTGRNGAPRAGSAPLCGKVKRELVGPLTQPVAAVLETGKEGGESRMNDRFA